MMFRHITQSLEERAIEWTSALVLLVWAVTLALPGEMLDEARYKAFNAIPIGDLGWSMLFAFFGAVHLTVLYINGRSPKTPYWRVACSLFGFIIFLWMSSALAERLFIIDVTWLSSDGLYLVGTVQTQIGPDWGVYLVLAMGNWLSIYRATKDCRYQKPKAA